MKVIWLLCGWLELTRFQCGRSELTCFLVCGPKNTCFSVSIEIGVVFVWLVEVDLISRGDWTWLNFSAGMNWFGCCGWSKLTWFYFEGSELTWFQWRDQKCLAFCLAVENDLFLVYELKFTRFWCRGNEIDLILDWGSKLTWFQWWGRNQLGFYVRYRAWVDFSLRIAIDLVICGGRQWLGFVFLNRT